MQTNLAKKKNEIDTLETYLKNNKNEKDENIRQLEVLKSSYNFIETDEKKFGKENTEYDFDVINIKEKSEESGNLQKEIEKLKKMVKINVDEVGDSIEKQYKQLMSRKEIVTEDRKRIEKTIEELDTKKKEALLSVWEKVNKDFGSIFSTLLPSAKSYLELINKDDITAGIEFKVQFKDIVKESLAELSGGQRTLLALSYIFALLKCKPAPIYILDEIDAALDISHTQNIGIMIREQFPQSQFLVVSLKEGMFNNANVLYRVSFVTGSSKVERIALRIPRKSRKKK